MVLLWIAFYLLMIRFWMSREENPQAVHELHNVIVVISPQGKK